MRGSRYMRSRQKSCQQCSNAKAKCDRQAGTCSRCAQRGLSCHYPQTQASPEPEHQELTVGAPDQQSSPVATSIPDIGPITPTVGGIPAARILHELLQSHHARFSTMDTWWDHQNPMTGKKYKFPDGYQTLDFDSEGAALVCPMNVDEIASRWLNTFVPIPGQKTKKYPANITAYMRRILGSYASKAAGGRGLPPFIHSSQTDFERSRGGFELDKPQYILHACLTSVSHCKTIPPKDESRLIDLLQGEMAEVYEQRGTYDDFGSLSALQAYLLYALVLFFRLGRAADQTFRNTIINLQELACASSRRGLMCVAEQQRARPRWEDWIVAEAKRRTLYAMYIFDNVLSAEEGLPTFIGVELQGLLAPGPKDLWGIESRQEWQTAYDSYMADWPEGGLRIDELWPTPPDLNQSEVDKRQQRVEHWLETVDEYGMMIYVSSRSSNEE